MASTMDSTMPSMPGSYLFQPDHNRSSGRSHNIFQPPAPSPSPSQRLSQIPRSTSRSSNSSSRRKRPRLDTNTSYFSRPARPSINNRSNTTASTPFSLDGSYDHVSYNSNNLESSTYSLDDRSLASPSPLANSEYRLAGGLDTPSASLERGFDELAQDEAERDYRLNRYTTTNTSRTTLSTGSRGRIDTGLTTPDLGTTSSNGKKRIRSNSTSHRYQGSLTGWGIRNTAWALTGGLAGRVFNFCINTAFRGFSAGGGDTYGVDLGASQMSGVDTEHMNSVYDSFANHYDRDSGLPGEYPNDIGGFIDDYMNSPESRRKNLDYTSTSNHSEWDFGSTDKSAIKNDWQIIDRANIADSGDEQSPARKRSRASVAGGWQRPVSRNAMASRAVSNTTGASYASPRARSSMGTYQHQQQQTISSDPFHQPPIRRSRPSFAQQRQSTSSFLTNTNITTGQTSPERPSSSASTRQYQTSSATNIPEPGLSPEVVTYRRKLKQREKLQDENLRRLNAQLRDMIREGKEALGSRVEVFDEYGLGGGGGGVGVREDFDERFYEDGWK